VSRLKPQWQVCFSFFFLFFILLMIYLVTGRLHVCKRKRQHLAPVDTNGKEGPKRWFHRLGPRFFFPVSFFDYFLLHSKTTTPKSPRPPRHTTPHLDNDNDSIPTTGQRDGATTGPGKVVTTKTGPNDARRVVWALIGTFFLHVFIY
jgi:hypothetical protein